MKRVNKTEKNLQTVWDNLDKAYELIERALDDLNLMVGISDEVKNDMERFDISKISSLKNDVEELMEELKVNKGVKEGMRVKHVSHGKGIILNVDKFDLDSITVEFDVEPKGWGNPLRVSKSCSKIMMRCAACGQECFEDEIYPQAVFWDDKKCICEECSIDFEEVDGVIKFRQDLIDDGCIEPVWKEKL